ncbi:hypothetical protein EJ110_NYTH09170 [Nymphaea thermarum]|nr:hypothetical protein EJ110_NYTH09170 [Nymphaea thermarum]
MARGRRPKSGQEITRKCDRGSQGKRERHQKTWASTLEFPSPFGNKRRAGFYQSTFPIVGPRPMLIQNGKKMGASCCSGVSLLGSGGGVRASEGAWRRRKTVKGGEGRGGMNDEAQQRRCLMAELVKSSQEKKDAPLNWAVEVSKLLQQTGGGFPSLELGDALVSHLCWDNNTPLVWKFIDQAMNSHLVSSLHILALLSSRFPFPCRYLSFHVPGNLCFVA